ncbi:hypothetical protein Tco_0841165 [Tanacetum coccineum]|uniref:CCHC-type domain-containing protein n=1 Tax=Tanacetum coccineum TaxID=301880 RepID=A0ABQ5AZ50_9ASTR
MFRRNQGEKEQCTFCGKDGHNEDGCFKVIGYPDWWPGKDRQGKQRPRTVRVEGELWPTLWITEAQVLLIDKTAGKLVNGAFLSCVFFLVVIFGIVEIAIYLYTFICIWCNGAINVN